MGNADSPAESPSPDRLGRPRRRRTRSNGSGGCSAETASQQVSPEHASKDDRYDDDDDDDDLSDTSSSTTDNCFSPDNSKTVIDGEKGTRDSLATPLARGAQRAAASAPQGKDDNQQRSAILSSSSIPTSLPKITPGAAANVDDGKKVGDCSQGVSNSLDLCRIA